MFSNEIDSELRLVLLDQSIAPVLSKLVQDNLEYLSQWLDWPRTCKTEGEFSEFIKMSLHDYADGKSMVCAILYDGVVIGVAGFNEINISLECAKVGYWISESMQGKGIVTRVCKYLIGYAHESLGVNKVEISAAVENNLSRAVCERLGMNLEGVITNKEKVGGKILDHATYGVHKKTA